MRITVISEISNQGKNTSECGLWEFQFLPAQIIDITEGFLQRVQCSTQFFMHVRIDGLRHKYKPSVLLKI